MTILGIDEVGRGCWAGPLVAGAVVLPDSFELPTGQVSNWRLDDSKRLTKSQRQRADVGIRQIALAIGLGWVGSHEIDSLGLTDAVRLAMRRALESALSKGPAPDRIIIDGSINYLPEITGSEAVVKADGSVPAVSAASIVAKVARDAWMVNEAARHHPGYGFERHVGYGTRQHQLALYELGICDLHRRSFRPVAASAAARTDDV